MRGSNFLSGRGLLEQQKGRACPESFPRQMVRGHAKEAAREKAAKKEAKLNSSGSQLEARKKALKFQCTVCKAPAASYKSLVVHMESKHPGVPIPAES